MVVMRNALHSGFVFAAGNLYVYLSCLALHLNMISGQSSFKMLSSLRLLRLQASSFSSSCHADAIDGELVKERSSKLMVGLFVCF